MGKKKLVKGENIIKIREGKDTAGLLLYRVHDETLHISFIRTKEKFKRSGTAKKLLNEAEKIAKDKKLAKIDAEITGIDHPQFIAWVSRNGRWSNARTRELYNFMKKMEFGNDLLEIAYVKEFVKRHLSENEDYPANFANLPALKLFMGAGFEEVGRKLSEIHKGKRYIVIDRTGKVRRTDSRDRIKKPENKIVLYFPVYIMEKKL